MKVVLVSFLLALAVQSDTELLKELRDNFGQFDKKEELCKSLLTKTKNSKSTNSSIKGYQAVLTMSMAEHVVNPYNKYSYFNKGKAILEEAIKKDPFNVELRCLRYTVQFHTPKFLEYKGNMKDDLMYMKQKVKSISDKKLQEMVESAIQTK